MTQILATLIPVAALIALGNILRRRKILDEPFWEAAERLVFFVLFPCLLFNKTATADMADVAVGPMASVLLAAIVATAFVTVLAQSLSDTRGPGFAAVFQGATQQNTYIGFAVASGLLGLAGDILSAVAAAVMVPLVNTLSVVVLARLGKSRAKKKPGWGTVPLVVLRNPLIIALALGWAMNGAGLGAPPLIDGSTAILGQGALPLALLCVGAGLRLREIRHAGRPVFVSAFLKLAVLPAAAFLGCLAVGLDGGEALVAILFAALPTSASAYMLSRRMGGDSVLLAGIITVETLAAAVTIPLAIALADLVFGPVL